MIKLFLLLIFFIISGCDLTSAPVPKSEVVHASQSLAKDIEIPKSIFKEIVQDIKTDSPTAEPVYLFQPLEVVFDSEQSNVMKQKNSFKFLNGGGQVDLKNILIGQGSFYFYFPVEQFEKMPNLEHLYYINEYPKKNIDKENFGLGCGQWVDLKSKFSDFKKPKEIILNTTAERYLYVAAGYYVFVFRKNNQVYLTHLHLTNSKYDDLKCPHKNKIQSEKPDEIPNES